METPGTYEYLLRQLLLDPQVMLSQVELPQGCEILEASVDDYGTGSYANCSEQEAQAISQAILQDAGEGNLYGIETIRSGQGYPAAVHIRAIVDDGYDVDNQSIYLELAPTMTHTIDALLDAGLITAETVEQWNQTMGAEVYTTVAA